MTEGNHPWESVNADETITAEDLKKAENIDVQTPVGQFLCLVTETTPVEKTFQRYNCWAAKLKMKIEKVLKIEMPVKDSKGEIVEREGTILRKIMDVPEEKADEINALYSGRFIFDEINLFHRQEKEAMRNRRLFVAKRLGIIPANAETLTPAMWANSPGRYILVTTEWNHWKDKTTGEKKKNVRVTWSGYDFAKDTQPIEIVKEEFDI